MKKLFLVSIMVCFIGINVSGCLKRISLKTVEKERIDQDVSSGNQGFVVGEKPPVHESKPRAITRKIYQVTFEVPPYPEWKNFRTERTEDKELWGNRGYVYGGPGAISQKPDEKIDDTTDMIVLPDETRKPEVIQPVVKRPPEPMEQKIEFALYTVQKGDTLQKISLKKYGTTKKWKKIFDFNSNVLKSPNKIYPGQKIKIPKL